MRRTGRVGFWGCVSSSGVQWDGDAYAPGDEDRWRMHAMQTFLFPSPLSGKEESKNVSKLRVPSQPRLLSRSSIGGEVQLASPSRLTSSPSILLFPHLPSPPSRTEQRTREGGYATEQIQAATTRSVNTGGSCAQRDSETWCMPCIRRVRIPPTDVGSETGWTPFPHSPPGTVVVKYAPWGMGGGYW